MHPLRVKICGVTTPADVAACADAGTDAVGINFYPQSPRYVDPRAARPLLRAIPPLMPGVGVFVDQPLRQMSALAYQLGLRALQHHGEPPVPEDPFPFQLIVAVRARDRQSLADVEAYLGKCRAAGHVPAAILVDAYVEGRHGGTGQLAPWDLLTDFRPDVPIILAGGLTPDNVGDAVRRVRPAGVDVASGVESAPGRKDPEKVRRFVANARDAAAGL
ncbi:MAG TPA: phosphoribosylanthranilate isomerase [Gemmataceae bacterium]|nr:phosphoribosylanthranilate isomerase [Gemmataceae bacterium]